MKIAVVVYDKMTALDALGPYAVMAMLPGREISFVAAKAGPVVDDCGALAVTATRTFDDYRDPEIVIVPGGFVTRRMSIVGDPCIEWLREVHPRTQWTTSVCTGALLLGAAGLLKGLRATTHWVAYDELAAFGADPDHERVIVHPERRIITAAGVSAGIDMGLRLAQELAGDRVAQRIQLGMEYDPQPPFDAGSPLKAPPDLVEEMRTTLAESKRRLLADLTPKAAEN
ncbi:DJ-1/PfpI family protein [Amycolatopsis pithecellobii]|uniref:DJ-1/PfpI family protein n=1 Tax=Amycolatopsis pithecellobii TaxID=664692 RepID=A0A6N7Z7Z7_9PSEU|nr:DJ-1/PfpI family protein [Amycolatopsis pithecellobii]MTD57581.1 DJ-1/PfpI family protein [Amycolatopsis pithecellobii]